MTTGLAMHFQVADLLLDSALDCEAEVFLRWSGNTAGQLADEYGAYEDATVFLVVADRDDHVVGAVRLLAPGGRAGLKTLVDVGEPPWTVDGRRSAAAVGIDLTSTWEVATLGVRRTSDADRAQLALALYHGLMTIAQVNRMTSFVAVLDERVRRLLSSVGIITQPLPGTSTAPYLGSGSSTPVYCHFGPMLENQRLRFPDAYRLVTLGIGLDGVSVPPRESFRLDRSRLGVGATAAPARRVIDLTALESAGRGAPGR
jgi:N-acyl-L-homoserine lactone synthetase